MIKIKTTIDNLNINYIKEGIGKTVLILPGWGTTIAVYRTIIDSIKTYANVICLDMPGFGESEEPKKSWNLDEYIEFVIKFIKDQKIKELDLIGHSNGGRIIIKLMGRENLDFKVNKIVLIGSAGIVHEKTLSQKIRIRLFKISKKIVQMKPIKAMFPKLVEKMKNKFGSADYRNASPVMKETLVKLVNEDLREYLPKINVPTLLLWGENDTDTPIKDAYIMEKLIPDAGLVKIERGTHYVFLERAVYINKIISTFLNGGN